MDTLILNRVQQENYRCSKNYQLKLHIIRFGKENEQHFFYSGKSLTSKYLFIYLFIAIHIRI